MNKVSIGPAAEYEKEWAAMLIARSEPWTTLGTTPENCLWFCKNAEYVVFAARMDGTPCGAMVIHPRGLASSPYLKSIVVEEGYRDQGIGRAMLKYGEDHFRSSSKHFFLCVSSFNTKARALYEKLGYKKVGEFSDYIIEGQSEILLYKRLR